MKIPQQLPQFKSEKSLLVVTGSHHGILYEAKNGEIKKLEEIRIDTPEYSDNEGMFKRGGGSDMSYGSVLEFKKDKAQEEFAAALADTVEKIRRSADIGVIYLYAPAHMKSLIEQKWSNDAKGIIRERFDGNYVFKTPPQLLAMLAGESKEE